MTEIDRRRLLGLSGFLLPCALLVALYFAYSSDTFGSWGWKGGEYAYAFIGVAVGAILLGCLVKLFRLDKPGGAFGTGLVLGGTLGVVVVIGLVVLFFVAWSRM
ncbi:hypothetical protein [Saccharothrix sp.]|uniref:hypothetical protein n=1 Tax=Saccharothrix sp. TaxID=1873460 RepID=UPI00281234D1|nr:hypothetical protein [Saccharothrix sp.]